MIRHPALANTTAAPNAMSPAAPAVSDGPRAPAIASSPAIPPIMSPSATAASGPAAATCVAAIAMSDIPALAISTAPPNANSPVALDESAGPIAPAIASSAAIPPIMIVIPANAIGPAAAS